MYLTITDNFRGLSVPNAIVAVGGLTLADDHQTMTFSVTYKMADSTGEFYNSEFYGCDYDVAGKDIITQAYDHLKTLDKFSKATVV